MGKIRINDMRFYAHHGCFEQERAIGTHFSMSLELEVDTSLAEQTDDVADTVNYLEVYQVVKAQMAQPSHLLEHVARRVGEEVMRKFPRVQCLTVSLRKLNPPLGGQMDSVEVELSFAR